MKNKINYLIFAKRRRCFIGELPENSLVIIPNKTISFKTQDVEYRFRPDSDFYYLTGFDEANSICILKKEKQSYEFILFVEPKDKDKEIWTGKRTGVSGARSHYMADKAYLISQFKEEIKKLMQSAKNIYYALGKDKDMDSMIINILEETRKSIRSGVSPHTTISDPRDILHKMRLVKDKYEIECIKTASRITKEAHILAMCYAKPGVFEYELEGLIECTFRTLGANGPAYPSIVGSGDNGTILHYTKNSKRIKNGEMILIDAGCEFGYYASDLTRTFPVTKSFSGVQKDLYEIVLSSQLSAINQIKPGKRFIDSGNKAVQVIVDGLKELKLLKGSTEKIIKKGEYKKFFMHRVNHWLGLDVHDSCPYFDQNGNSIKLEPGMVLTVEPGLYLPNDLDLKGVSKRFKGIGIRIEDDVLVTKDGNKILTEGMPKTIAEIEALR